jgi:hypothetical protein
MASLVRASAAVLGVSAAVVAARNAHSVTLYLPGAVLPDVPVWLVLLAAALCGAMPGLLLGLRLGGGGSRAAHTVRRLTEQAAEREWALEALRRRNVELRYDLESARRRVAPCAAEEPPEVPDGWQGQPEATPS